MCLQLKNENIHKKKKTMFFLLIPKLNHMDFSYCLKLQILMEATKKSQHTNTDLHGIKYLYWAIT